MSNYARCTVRFLRCGAGIEPMREHAGTTIDAQAAPPGDAGLPWSWPVHRFTIPRTWRSGAYVAVLGDATDSLDARGARALFIVRPQHPSSPVVYDLPIFTYHAYNVALDPHSERTCLYNNARSVTLMRPGGGVGGYS